MRIAENARHSSRIGEKTDASDHKVVSTDRSGELLCCLQPFDQ
jgi:hypothetical protein